MINLWWSSLRSTPPQGRGPEGGRRPNPPSSRTDQHRLSYNTNRIKRMYGQSSPLPGADNPSPPSHYSSHSPRNASFHRSHEQIARQDFSGTGSVDGTQTATSNRTSTARPGRVSRISSDTPENRSTQIPQMDVDSHNLGSHNRSTPRPSTPRVEFATEPSTPTHSDNLQNDSDSQQARRDGTTNFSESRTATASLESGITAERSEAQRSSSISHVVVDHSVTAILPSGSAMDRRCLEQSGNINPIYVRQNSGNDGTVHGSHGQTIQLAMAPPRTAPVFMTPEITQSLALAAIKAQDPALEARSMRRGALITMAEAGAPISVLLNFSKHKSSAMLYRYLGWGWHCAADRESGALAAQSLLSGLSD